MFSMVYAIIARCVVTAGIHLVSTHSQGFTFINFDPEMKCPVSKEHARCRNRGLNEDLGKVEYIFSDKTGTLTGNEMQLRMITVKDAVFGRDDWRIEEHSALSERECVKAFDPLMADCLKALSEDTALWDACLQGGGTPAGQLAAGSMGTVRGDDMAAAKGAMVEECVWLGWKYHVVVVGTHSVLCVRPSCGDVTRVPGTAMGQHILDFWLNLCVCQSLIVDPEATGDTMYQVWGRHGVIPVHGHAASFFLVVFADPPLLPACGQPLIDHGCRVLS